ncbi:MAG: hypothetical protein RLY31_868 [Bacteroidota bacterium]
MLVHPTRHLLLPFLSLVFLLLSHGCVTQKSREDIGAVGKAYHNMTARYNGYYNATVLLYESTLTLEGQVQDNYRNILPVYKYLEADNPKAVAESLDKAIKKVSVAANLHRISHWTDDCYLLMGQAQFLKQDYESAEETLEFMMAEFNPLETAKREAKAKSLKNKKKAIKKGVSDKMTAAERSLLSKKEKEKLAKLKRKIREKDRKRKLKEVKKARKLKKKGKAVPQRKKTDPDKESKDTETQEPEETSDADPLARPAPGSIRLGTLGADLVESDPETYFLQHRPCYQEGVLWLAKTYIERENFTNAERLLSQLEKSPATFSDVRREVAVVKTVFYLKQKQYDLAVEPLETAINLSDNRQVRARLAFILGQVHQLGKRKAAAAAAFEKVLRNSPSFEMEFTARLNLAQSGDDPATSVKNLERMLREEKNLEYKDQLYFALAGIALENGDRAGAMDLLKTALLHSTTNTVQKAESYLLLADLYFEDQEFVSAKSYYDSTLQVLANTDERYPRVSATANNLEDIANHIRTINLQDSLLRISRMSEEERLALAEKIFREREEERLRQLKQQSSSTAPPGTAKGSQPADAKARSRFWAYDEKEVKRGEREFERKWGSRELADNWRRANQESILDGTEGIASEAKGGPMTEEDVREIFKDVPDAPEKVLASNRQIEAALFALGSLYRDRLQNYPRAIASLLELLERYPETQYKLDALYYLYLSHKEMGDADEAQRYFDIIVQQYPNSNYARILQDPEYLQRMLAKENSLTSYYDETYAAFNANQYQLASDRIAKAAEKFGATNKLQPRFALLNAMCIGNLQGKEPYVEALKEVIAKYPDEPEAARSREILRLLGEKIGSGPGQQRNLPTEAGQVGNFKVADEDLHFVIVVFLGDVSLNDAKIRLSDYHNKYHSLQKLRTNNIYLGDGDKRYPIIAIRRFKNKDEAMDYLDTARKNAVDFLDASRTEFELMPIGQDNYRELLRTKNIDDYRTFSRQHYRN